MAIPFPNINPITFSVGPLQIHWYGLAYVVATGLGYLLIKNELQNKVNLNAEQQSDVLVYLCCGLIIGGRVAYILFYQSVFYYHYPLEMLKIWQGGMSFHGACLGIFISLYLFTKRYKKSFWALLDCVCLVAPIGLFLGRIANFINAELFGRITTAPWGMVFPGAGPLPRHPSQLYEAGIEGLALGIILYGLHRFHLTTKAPGTLACYFAGLYSLGRFFIEFFREPDTQLGLIMFNLSMGQLLCIALGGLAVFTGLKLNQKS